METKFLCKNHIEEAITSLFVGQRLVIDTNIRLSKGPHNCEFEHKLIPNSQCQLISSAKVTILAKYEPYQEPTYLEDMKRKPNSTYRSFQTRLP